MEITLSDDQEFFRDTTRRFLAMECPIDRVRELASTAPGFERDFWRQGAELGWTSMLVPEELGGGSVSGRGVVDITLIADAFGRNVAPGPLVPTNVVAAAIARSGSEALRADHLPELISGDTIAAWCVGEPPPDDALGQVTTTATADADEVVISGVKAPIEGAAEADVLLVTARTDTGLAQYLVPADTPGLTITPLAGIDLVRRFARVELDGVRVPRSAAVGGSGSAESDVERQLQLALVMQTAEMVGLAETVFDFTVEWAFDRYSFGRPLASYQELKHRFADMKTWLEASHALATAAARDVQDDADSAAETVSAAKAYLGDHLAELIQDCVQMHGGIGLTADHDIHLFLRRMTADRATYGTPADHRRRIARLLVEGRGVSGDSTAVESVESFAARARTWLAENMPKTENPAAARGAASASPWVTTGSSDDEAELAWVADARQLQRTLYDGGFAGICFPTEYGGLGLTAAHQQAFNVECFGFQMPSIINVPTFVPCGAVLLEFGTEEQKQRHIPAMLRGEELWMQFLSEPSGGSDVAGALATAVRDGDEWVINGSKIWTTGAWWSDYGLCLLRTNWDVPKHSGLSVFIVPIDHPDIEVQRIEMINGSREFCQEFMTDLRVADSARVGDVDDGWTIGRRWMFHERNAMGGGSPYVSGPAPGTRRAAETDEDPLVALARDLGRLDDDRALDLIGEARVLRRAAAALSNRVGAGMATGALPDTSAAIARLMSAVVAERTMTIWLELSGSSAAAWSDDDPAADIGIGYLMRQSGSIAGGTTEMARNNISERVLGMPRERTFDKDIAFRDIPKGPT